MGKIFKKYKDYFKDNPKKYWFKRKIYGWGWVPVTWQGWLVVAIYIGALLFFGFTIDASSSDKEIIFTFFLPILFLSIILIRICYKKGEKPRWQWGIPKKDKNS
ncbi:MAG: hypothetical protein FJZ43_00320 [Candidatus Staskawiczbacteria bacterium]|nr:hypothetical protein [Candidatus Staskawiczbacteria bacterium]